MRKELTAAKVARLAGCSRQAVMEALVTWRLRGRKIGRALIWDWDKDAETFARSLRRRQRSSDEKSQPA